MTNQQNGETKSLKNIIFMHQDERKMYYTWINYPTQLKGKRNNEVLAFYSLLKKKNHSISFYIS